MEGIEMFGKILMILCSLASGWMIYVQYQEKRQLLAGWFAFLFFLSLFGIFLQLK